MPSITFIGAMSARAFGFAQGVRASTAIAVAHDTTPFVTAYPWSTTGFGTKVADPASLPASTGNGVAFTPSGSDVAVAAGSTVYAYPWTTSGFGTKYTNASGLTIPVAGVAF